jgi:hypothetical protein
MIERGFLSGAITGFFIKERRFPNRRICWVGDLEIAAP